METYDELKALLVDVMRETPLLTPLLLSDESDDPYGVSMTKLAALLLMMHKVKDNEYGRSWAKRGEMGVFHNLMRKSDRLEQLGLLNMFGDVRHNRVALVDLLIDCATYCLMWVAYIVKVRPDSLKAWLQDVWCKSTDVSFDDVIKFLELD